MVKVTQPKFRTKEGLSVIAQPLLTDKLMKKSLKLVKKACKDRLVFRGVKEVNKGLRKLKNPGKECIVLIAGDISPIDVVSHLPGYCEELQVSYAFVPSKNKLGEACASKRPTSCLLIKKKLGQDGEEWELKEAFAEVSKKINKVAPVYA